MMTFNDDLTIHLYLEPIDMRKAIDGLSYLVSEHCKQSLQSGDVFVFHNRANDKVKLLCWHRNGFILLYKRLEKKRFKFKELVATGELTITTNQLNFLLAGLDFTFINAFPELSYDDYF